MPDVVEVCPECDQGGLAWIKHSTEGRNATHPHDYRCKKCGHTFDEPVCRPSRVGEKAAQRALRTADVDEVL